MDSESLSFDNMTALYDETRTWDDKCFSAALDYLEARFPPARFRKVFEPGIGNGRITIPLAGRGYDVTGVDISSEMLSLLHDRMLGHPHLANITFLKADVTSLPFPDAEFDMTVVVHLFYFIPDWKTAVDELTRVIKPGGSLILMHTGSGQEIPEINQRYKELCADLGFTINQMGVSSTSEVVQYLQESGRTVALIQDRWRWTTHIQIKRALQYMQHRAYSFTTLAPDAIHHEALARLSKELINRYGNMNTVLEIPNQISLAIIANQKV